MMATSSARATARPDRARLLARIALILTTGALLAALIASIGSGQGAWSFRPAFTALRWCFYAAAAGGVLAIVALAMSRGRRRAAWVALALALALGLYLANWSMTAKQVPPIHDVTTNLADPPAFRTLKLRPDNLETIPDGDRPELAALSPEARWRALHREAYSDLTTVQLPSDVAQTVARVRALAEEKGWEVAAVDPRAGIVEATATTRFFRFKDDVVIRVRPAPAGGSLVDLRSVSRVGVSDVGANAERIRNFVADLK